MALRLFRPVDAGASSLSFEPSRDSVSGMERRGGDSLAYKAWGISEGGGALWSDSPRASEAKEYL